MCGLNPTGLYDPTKHKSILAVTYHLNRKQKSIFNPTVACLNRRLFTHRRFYTQTLLHTDAFTHRSFYTQTPLHTDAFITHKGFYTQTHLHTDAFTHRRFYTQTLSHTETGPVKSQFYLRFLAIEPHFACKGCD